VNPRTLVPEVGSVGLEKPCKRIKNSHLGVRYSPYFSRSVWIRYGRNSYAPSCGSSAALRKNRAKRPINTCKNQPLLAKLLGSIDPSIWNRPVEPSTADFVLVLKRDRVMV